MGRQCDDRQIICTGTAGPLLLLIHLTRPSVQFCADPPDLSVLIREYPNGVVGVRAIFEDFLLLLARQVPFPNVEFIVNYSDYPQFKRRTVDTRKAETEKEKKTPNPVLFSMCKTEEHTDILLPTYQVLQVYANKCDQYTNVIK